MFFGALESTLLNYFLESAPIILVLGVILLIVYRDNKELVKKTDETNRETITHLRQQDRDNIETLNDISRLLGYFIEEARANNVTTNAAIRDEAEKTRKHIDERITEIRNRIE